MRLPWRFCLTLFRPHFHLFTECAVHSFSVYLPVRLYPHVILLFLLKPGNGFLCRFSTAYRYCFGDFLKVRLQG